MKYERVRAELPPFISQHKAAGWEGAGAGEHVCSHIRGGRSHIHGGRSHLHGGHPQRLGQAGLGLYKQCSSAWERAGVRVGVQGLVLPLCPALGMGQGGKPIPIHTTGKTATCPKVLQVQRFFGSFGGFSSRLSGYSLCNSFVEMPWLGWRTEKMKLCCP